MSRRRAWAKKNCVTELEAGDDKQYLQSRVVFLFLFSCAVLYMVTKRQNCDGENPGSRLCNSLSEWARVSLFFVTNQQISKGAAPFSSGFVDWLHLCAVGTGETTGY